MDELGPSGIRVICVRPNAIPFPTLAEVANYAALVASDRTGAMTGAIANFTCGSIVD